jgi:hypothetical protein
MSSRWKLLMLGLSMAAGWAFTGTSSGQSSAADIPLCPDASEAVQTYPPTFVRRGESYTASIERNSSNVTSVDVVYTVPNDPAPSLRETLSFTTGDTINIVRAGPTTEDESFGIQFSWIQDSGTPAACRGNDNYWAVPIIDPDLKAGDPDVARFSGGYQMSYHRDKGHPTWHVKSLCDVFGCSATVRSSGGLRGKFTINDDGTFELSRRVRIGHCDVIYIDGRNAKWSIFGYQTVKLRPTRVVNGVATRLRGTERWEYDVPSDPTGGCKPPGDFVQGLVAARRD